MAIQLIAQLKTWFQTGKKPTQAQYHDLMDSYAHHSDGQKLAIERVDGLPEALAAAGSGVEIVNNLTTGGATKALSAQQGVVLKALIDAIEVITASNGLTKTGADISLGGTVIETKTINNGEEGAKGIIVFDPDFGIVFQSGTGINYVIDNNGFRVLNDFATLNATNAISKQHLIDYLADFVGSAPETLDTLNELAAALGDDPNFATTVSTALGLKAATTYVDAEILKQSPAIGIFITATTSDSGVNYTGTTSSTLATFPKIFNLRSSSLNLLNKDSLLNIEGTGAIKVRDINGDEINGTLQNNKDYYCYYDNVLQVYRILNHANISGVQTGTLSGNNYIFSKNFDLLPDELPFRISATNPTATPQASIIVSGGSPVLKNLVDEVGATLPSGIFQLGRIYKGYYNSANDNYEIQGINKNYSI